MNSLLDMVKSAFADSESDLECTWGGLHCSVGGLTLVRVCPIIEVSRG